MANVLNSTKPASDMRDVFPARHGRKAVRTLAVFFCASLTVFSSRASSMEKTVDDAASLRAAIESARPGDRIVLKPGEYRLRKQYIRKGGKPDNPIIMTALVPARTRIHTGAVELFKLAAPHWVFEKLTFMGTGGAHHAFHIVRDADYVVLRNNRFLNFHSAIKGNPEGGRSPDHVIVERNIFLNDEIRQTRAPTTPIDILGGVGWIIRENFIADFGRNDSHSVSYGVFLKGGSRDGLIERNFVVCEWRRPGGGRRVGISLGGGGSSRNLLAADGTEHGNGIIRNNIILNCPSAPGIYLNRASNSKIYNNTIYNAYGIMARYPAEESHIRNNIVSGAIAERSGARLVVGNNLTTGWDVGAYIPGGTLRAVHRISDYHVKYPSVFNSSNIRWAQDTIRGIAGWLGRSGAGRGIADFRRWFAAPEIGNFSLVSGAEFIGKGETLPEVKDDFCGNSRGDSTMDLGAIEYRAGSCNVTAWLRGLFQPFE